MADKFTCGTEDCPYYDSSRASRCGYNGRVIIELGMCSVYSDELKSRGISSSFDKTRASVKYLPVSPEDVRRVAREHGLLSEDGIPSNIILGEE